MKKYIFLIIMLGLLIFTAKLSIPDLAFPHEGHDDDPFKRFGIFHLNGQEAPPEFKLPNMKGEMVSLSDFRGRAVFLNIMTLGCEPCQKEMPAMERLHRAYREKGLAVLGIFIDVTADNTPFMREYLSENGLTFPVLFLQGGTIQGLRIGWTPLTYLINQEGRLVGKAMGFKDWTSEEARGVIEDLLVK